MTASSGYSESELMQMQQDAIRRVREMQERARRSLQGSSDWNSTAEEAPPLEPVPQPEEVRDNRPPQSPPFNLGSLGSLFSGRTSSPVSGLLNWVSGDRTVILLLLILLMGEETDQTLLLALFYLLLFE